MMQKYNGKLEEMDISMEENNEDKKIAPLDCSKEANFTVISSKDLDVKLANQYDCILLGKILIK